MAGEVCSAIPPGGNQNSDKHIMDICSANVNSGKEGTWGRGNREINMGISWLMPRKL